MIPREIVDEIGEIVSDYMRARRSGDFIHNFVPAGSALRNICLRSVGTSFHDSLNPMEYDYVSNLIS